MYNYVLLCINMCNDMCYGLKSVLTISMKSWLTGVRRMILLSLLLLRSAIQPDSGGSMATQTF